jgi:hypothetical protein
MKNNVLLTKQDKEEFVFWIETLKAGVLPQGRVYLEDSIGKYCCLGVGQACSAENPKSELSYNKTYPKLVGSLPCESLGSPKWLIEISEMTFPNKKGVMYSLFYYNDQVEMPHPQIARMVWKALKHELIGFK